MNSFQENTTAILKRLSQIKVVPVLVLDSVEAGLKLCELLLQNGLPAAEVTFRTAAAAQTIRRARQEFPELLIGAGTILSRDTLRQAQEAGAQFAVAPGFNPVVVQEAVTKGFPFIPGICTPSEFEQAHELGCTFVKFFPAENSGGIKFIQDLIGPYRQLGIRFMPTGGVKPENLDSYLQIPEIACVGGTWLAKAADLKTAAATNDWSSISSKIAATVAIAAKYRQ